MPPHHVLFILLCLVGLPTVLTFFSLIHSHPRGQTATESTPSTSKSGIRTLFSFHTPSTLFPPSAIISLTDDNTTFFLARPADFGPSLSSHGLSGQLWIGSGFGDDDPGRGGASAGAEGELGCSDVPGWEGRNLQYRRDIIADQNAVLQGGIEATIVDANAGGAFAEQALDDDEEPSEEDGTDDHLHHPLPNSPVSKPAEPGLSPQHPPAENGQTSIHADIQSLQESAEIAGKIVLLSRGGCGFLEKVKWTQRRGGTALIVGDHTRGGPLVTMYARGDTINVTIPSIFTSHTTAHLLSSLIPPDDETDGTNATKEGPRKRADNDRPTFTPAPASKSTNTLSKSSKGRYVTSVGRSNGTKQRKKSGWLGSIASTFGLRNKIHAANKMEDSRRPPSSGRNDWFNEKWTEESSKERQATGKGREIIKDKGKEQGKSDSTRKDSWKSGSQPSSSDDFVIGVQDWRDPDLVPVKPSQAKTKSTTTTQATAQTPQASKGANKGSDSAEQRLGNTLSGGSITPGSGEYHKPANAYKPAAAVNGNPQSLTGSKFSAAAQGVNQNQYVTSTKAVQHVGLWVTLTPTTMSTSPFFDTLLVLVVSPLVTLTVVYALLLLRSRIRRRRWRAPKSVVDRLPVRTYHTMSCASTTSSTRLASPHSSSPNSPLLHPSPLSLTVRSRPRSATTPGIGDAISASLERATTRGSPTRQGEGAGPIKEKKYNGKQIECVVCLEEYVDGQSKVMSLPCGHEFHAECITPWLTTRRRTCPICKGDVVRSMADPSSATAVPTNHRPYHDDPDDGDIQAQVAETANDSPSAAIPIPRDHDLERGEDMAATLVNDQSEVATPRSGWRGLAASLSLSAFTGEVAWRQAQADRNR